jgi:energy-coupling factor transport system ATP-binding protein
VAVGSSGEVVVFGRSTVTHHPRELADVVGFVAQDPRRSSWSTTSNATWPSAREPRLLRRSHAPTVEETLDALGSRTSRPRPRDALRWRTPTLRDAGARASPSAPVLDEPTSQLDLQGSRDVLAALTRLNTDLGTTVVLAEHRLDRAAPLAVVSRGRRWRLPVGTPGLRARCCRRTRAHRASLDSASSSGGHLLH